MSKRPPSYGSKRSERARKITVYEKVPDKNSYHQYEIIRVTFRFNPGRLPAERAVRYDGGYAKLFDRMEFCTVMPEGCYIIGPSDYLELKESGAPNDFIVVDGNRFSTSYFQNDT